MATLCMSAFAVEKCILGSVVIKQVSRGTTNRTENMPLPVNYVVQAQQNNVTANQR